MYLRRIGQATFFRRADSDRPTVFAGHLIRTPAVQCLAVVPVQLFCDGWTRLCRTRIESTQLFVVWVGSCRRSWRASGASGQ